MEAIMNARQAHSFNTDPNDYSDIVLMNMMEQDESPKEATGQNNPCIHAGDVLKKERN